MLELGNVAVIDAWSLLKSGGWSEWLQDSPLDQLGPALESSVFRVEHVSDAIRLLLIWKFGGTYLDLDFISIRSLDDLGNDWVGAEDRNIVSNAALNAAPAGPGHAMFENFLKEFAEKFDGAHWAVNGPYLLTNVIYKVCNLTKGTDMQEVGRMKNCGFTVHTQKFFYPISYATWRNYFSEKAWPVVNSSLGPSVHAIHFWNKLSKDEVVTVGSGQPYGRLASQYCPPVYYASVPAF
ncbi:hypothetical protein AAG570_008903 [Ranatra chinensis]|uniref:Alpha 1,4-glycosyltransferase domain-containing protein n=1 Tax=Ranatra chinensis TaxID=642074 RepID=A0ABD0YSA9_9HEMI